MFNSYTSNPTASIKVNSVSGTLAKTLKDSFFVRFNMESSLANSIFKKFEPYIENSYGYGSKIPIVVLQVMLCGDKEFLAEIITKEDYDKMFKEKNDD